MREVCNKCGRDRPNAISDPSCREGGYCEWITKKTLELTAVECASLASILLHEREALQTQIDGQPRKTGGVTGQCPLIDDLLLMLDKLYPEQKWKRFVE